MTLNGWFGAGTRSTTPCGKTMTVEFVFNAELIAQYIKTGAKIPACDVECGLPADAVITGAAFRKMESGEGEIVLTVETSRPSSQFSEPRTVWLKRPS